MTRRPSTRAVLKDRVPRFSGGRQVENTVGNTAGKTVGNTVGDKVPSFPGSEPCAYISEKGEAAIPPPASRDGTV